MVQLPFNFLRARRDSDDDGAKRSPHALSSQARMVLVLVVVFTAAFVAVISMKLTQERNEIEREAELRQARAAAFLAQRAGGQIAQALGEARGVAAGLATDWTTDGSADVFGHLSVLVESSELDAAALLAPDGRVRAATSTEAGQRLARALEDREGRRVWLSEIDGRTGLFAASDVMLSENARTLVAEIALAAVTPTAADGQLVALVGENGGVLHAIGNGPPPSGESAARTFGITASDVARFANGEASAARPGNRSSLVVGASPLGRSGVTLYIRGPLQIDDAAWTRTLVFFMLVLIAPILVAVGLCAVLLMQMDSIRQARQALMDSERRFRLAIDHARCGVWDWDISSDSVFITDSLARMLGRCQGATLTGAEFLALVREEDQDSLKAAIRGAIGANEVDVVFRPHGLPVWLHARGKPWMGPDGQLSGRIVGVAIDVTEQKGARDRIDKAETRLRAALESMGESFVLWDRRRRLVLSNSKFREFFHLDEQVVRPGAGYDMLEMAAQGAIKEVHEGSEPDASEFELTDGRWVHMSERRTRDGGMVSIGTDITALKRQELQLMKNEKRLRQTVAEQRKAEERLADLARKYEQEKIRAEDANRSKSEFLANMSHELRTPLNAINGFSEIMLEGMFGPLGDQRYQEYVGDILASGQHLLALINDILDMSKIEAGKLSLAAEPVFPDELAEQCARLMRGKAKDSELSLELDVDDLPEISCDPRALKQVLLNLLSNAIKFTPEGGRVVLRGRSHEDGVLMQVIDNGIGIDAKDLPRIGKPFEQIENQLSKSYRGSGLGLALSKSLIEMHGGVLSIESTLGEGTTVSFTLPAQPPVFDETDGYRTDEPEPSDDFGNASDLLTDA